MRDMGIRGRFAYGTPVGMADDAPMDFAGLARVKKDWMPDKDNLLTLGICSRNLGALTIGGSAAAASRGVLTIEQIKRDWDGARALGLPITMHTSGASPIMELERAGLLGSDVQFVHPLLTTPEERAILKARGASYSMSPQLEARRASQLGVIQLGELLEAGVKVSLSTDHIASISCDPFASMRILFALHSHRIGAKVPLTLEAAAAARDARRGRRSRHRRPHGLDHARQTRRPRPGAHHGRQHGARGRPLRGDRFARHAANVDTVIVDGRILRRAGKFTAFDHAKIVAEAREAAIGLRDKAKWPT